MTTPKGEISAEIVIDAGGLWAREVGRLVGLELPILAMQHHYLITDEIPEVAARSDELPGCIDFEGELYLRQEGKGLLVGTYEQDCRPWSEHTTPPDFSHELLPPDLDRIAPRLEVAFEHFPVLAEAGIKRVINGPFTFAPDGNPLVGPVPGLRNFHVACGVMAGFSQGGGVGLTLARWIVEGDPGMDVFAMDVARFGGFATRAYANAKVQENYRRRFSITFPNEELPAARPLRTTPVYERLKAQNAVFGASYGLEHALWFAPEGSEPYETPTFRRSNAHGPVGEECRAVREAVGLLEIANYAKYEVAGPAAAAWLDGLLANRLPEQGRMVLTPMLSPSGRLMGDLTLARLGPERFMIFGSGVAEAFHMRWFESRLPRARGVTVRPLAAHLGGFAIAGPRSRELLARLTDEDVSAEAFRFFAIRRMQVAMAPALVARVSFTGELGYEIYLEAGYQLAVYDTLLRAGEDLGLRHFGGRALHALRLEKSFGAWLREYTPDYTPFQSGLARYIDWQKGDFVGRDAAAALQGQPASHVLCHPGRRCARCRCGRRRAGAVGRAGRRLRHLGRLRPHGRQEHRARLSRAGCGSIRCAARGRASRRAPPRPHRTRAALRSRGLAHARLERQTHQHAGVDDHATLAGGLVHHVQPSLDRLRRHLAVRHGRGHRLEVDLVGLLRRQGQLDLHGTGIEPQAAEQDQRRVPHGILDRPLGRLGVVAAVQRIAGSHLEDDAPRAPLRAHRASPGNGGSGRSR